METATANQTSQREFFIQMALSAWNTQNERATKLFDSLTNEQLLTETAPGRNRGIYLLGHLIVVSDRLITLLGLGERLYSQLDEAFYSNPDKAIANIPSVDELRKNWNDINQKLSTYFAKISPTEWFEKHNSVSAEDFAKDPQRNKLNVVMNRTSHTAYHLGQLVYLKSK
jgi:hypothetical protein